MLIYTALRIVVCKISLQGQQSLNMIINTVVLYEPSFVPHQHPQLIISANLKQDWLVSLDMRKIMGRSLFPLISPQRQIVVSWFYTSQSPEENAGIVLQHFIPIKSTFLKWRSDNIWADFFIRRWRVWWMMWYLSKMAVDHCVRPTNKRTVVF